MSHDWSELLKLALTGAVGLVMILVKHQVKGMDSGQDQLLRMNLDQNQKIDRLSENVGGRFGALESRLTAAEMRCLELEKVAAIDQRRIDTAEKDINEVGKKVRELQEATKPLRRETPPAPHSDGSEDPR